MHLPAWIPEPSTSRALVLACALLATLSSTASAEAPVLEARLKCEPAPGPGRVRCALAVGLDDAWRFSWADALVIAAPDIARPLKARVPYRGSLKEPKLELLLGLVASSAGRGRLAVRVRALACPRPGLAGRCRTLTREASYELVIGGG